LSLLGRHSMNNHEQSNTASKLCSPQPYLEGA